MKLYVINIMKYLIIIIVCLFLIHQHINTESFTEKKGFSKNYLSVFDTHKLNFF